jgi:hypothetical protein
MKTKIISSLIVIFWIGMMFSLFRDKIFPTYIKIDSSDISPGQLAKGWEDSEEWMNIYYQGIKVGAMMTSVIKMDYNAGYALKSRLYFQLKILGASISLSMKAAAQMNNDLILQKFRANADIAGTPWEINGIYHKEKLYFRMKNGTNINIGSFKLEKAPSLLEAVESTLSSRIKLEVGKSYRIPVYDMIWSPGGGYVDITIEKKEKIRINDTDYDAFLIQSTINEMTTYSWVDKDGKTLKRQLIPGLFMTTAMKEDVLNSFPVFDQEISVPKDLHPKDFVGKETISESSQDGIMNMITKQLGK